MRPRPHACLGQDRASHIVQFWLQALSQPEGSKEQSVFQMEKLRTKQMKVLSAGDAVSWGCDSEGPKLELKLSSGPLATLGSC